MSLTELHDIAKHLFGPLIGENVGGAPHKEDSVHPDPPPAPKTVAPPAPPAPKKVAPPARKPVAPTAPKPKKTAVLKYKTLTDEFLPAGTVVDLTLKKPLVVPVNLPEFHLDYIAIMMAANPNISIDRDELLLVAKFMDNPNIRQFNDLHPKRISRCERIIKDSMQ